MSEQAKRILAHAAMDDSKICYWKTDAGWMLYLPGCGIGRLSGHTVVEHEDKTISVTPSIVMTGHTEGTPNRRHGFLTKGVWTEC